jgi:hypothetical protein
MITKFTACCPPRPATAWDIWSVQYQLSQTANDPNLTIQCEFIFDIEPCVICGLIGCEHLRPQPRPVMAFKKG